MSPCPSPDHSGEEPEGSPDTSPLAVQDSTHSMYTLLRQLR